MPESIPVKQVNPIIAIEILNNTYNIDVLRYTKDQVSEIVKLMNKAKKYKDLT